MARVDSILTLVDRQGANELRLGSDREPQMFASGAPKRLTMPKTSTDTLRELLGELLPPDRERLIAQQGQVQFLYESPSLGPFRVTFTRRGPAGAALELDVTFVRGRGAGAPPPAPTAPAARPAPEAAPRLVDLAPRVADQAPPPAVARASEGGAPPAIVGAQTIGAPTISSTRPALDAATPELAALLGRAASMRASDVHLVDGEAPIVRVDGRLRALPGEGPVAIGRLLGARLAAEVEQRVGAGASADLGIGVEGVGRFRVNVFQTSAGLSAAIRVLRGAPPALAELGLPMSLDDLVDLPHGLVLVCGATGCGKSTTLAALAHDALERRPGMVITLEDPIEYVLGRPGARGAVRQRQVGRDVKDFATGLRDALREDPDIIIIGEMRDPETISLALTAAETGHLVLASLHSRSAVSAVERIVDTYPPARQAQIRVQLADALRVVVAQRLLPRTGGEGRVLALEVLRGTHAVQNAIREAKTGNVQSAIQAGKKEGMLPLERCLADLVTKRQVTLEDARAAANDPTVLTSYLSG
ncbi:Twitching motility protein PilT [Minicystis rosea]|nr:Twitching motility protein PilT [Minicystis rosea]